MESQTEHNKRVVLEAWREVIDGLDEDAVLRYFPENYIQHTTQVADGRIGLLDGVRRLKEPKPHHPPHPKKTLVAAVAEGDLVTLVWTRDVDDPRNPGKKMTVNAFDMFRVESELIVEHWCDDGFPVR